MVKKTVTMDTIAKLASVSKSTVSRALADSPNIGDKTKKKINDIISELGYTPNEIARSLASKKTKNIGLILPHDADAKFFSSVFFQGALSGITGVAAESDYDVLIPQKGLSEIEAIRRFIKGKKVDGFILMRSYLKDEAIDYLAFSDFPFVVIGSYKDEVKFFCVDSDTYGMAYQITNQLIAYGCRRIAILEAEPEEMHVYRKLQGYRDALFQAGISHRSDYITDTRESVRRLLAGGERPDGIIVGDDYGGVMVIEEMEALGYRHEDIKIGVMNYTRMFKFGNMFDAMIGVNTERLGTLSAQKLVKLINGEVPEQKTVVPFEIIAKKEKMKQKEM